VPGNILDGLGQSTGLKTFSYIGLAGSPREHFGWPGPEYGSKDPQLHWVGRKSAGTFRMAWARVRV